MLSIALKRAQGQLQAHRRWLTTFASQTQQLGCSPQHSIRTDNVRHSPLGLGRQQHVRSLTATSSAASKAAKSWRRRQKASAAFQVAGDSDLDFANDFRQAISDVDIKDVIRLFPEAQKRELLDRNLTWRIAQCLHEALRRQKRIPADKGSREGMEEMIAFAEQLAKAIKKGDLEPDRRADLHLVAFFKESGAHAQGIAFWDWLEEQDDRYVDADVYGAAIELLAVYGTPLRELENLFQRVLQRFPGSFNAYHLSSDAVVPDREQAIEIKGIAMTLLQGILTARLLRGDSHKAYLALDTALRLYPALTPPRFFAMFVEERPLTETYTVFATACRAGIVLPFDTARRLLTALRSNADMSSHIAHITALRQMLSVVYMYAGAGGTITSNVINEIIIALTQTLRLKDVAGLEVTQKKQIVSTTLDITRKLLEVFARYGAKPGISAFNSVIVNLGGYGHSYQVIAMALQDIQALGLEANHVTRRSILTAAGLQGDVERAAEAWRDLVCAKAEGGERPDATDYHILVKAAKLCGSLEYAKEACKAAKGHLPEEVRQSLLERLHGPVEQEQSSGNGEALDVSSLLSKMEKLRTDLAVIDERTAGLPATQNFNDRSLPMTISSPSAQGSLPEDELRNLYDELTTEQSSALLAHPADALAGATVDQTAKSQAPTLARYRPPARSTTEIPFGTLRYENWKSINVLLALAERNDLIYDRAVDAAISAGVAPPARENALRTGSEQVGSYRGLTDVDDVSMDAEAAGDPEHVQKGRSEILRLRGRVEGL